MSRDTKHLSGNSRARTGGGYGAGRRTKKAKTGKAGLVIVNGCFSGLEINISKTRTTLGRDIGCDICLDHSLVSEEHAVITRIDGYYALEDLNSRHGTTVNGREVHKIRLGNGDLIGIGSFEIRFHE